MILTSLLLVIALLGIWKDYCIKNSKRIPILLAIILSALTISAGFLKFKQENDSKIELRMTTTKAHEEMISLRGEVRRLNETLEPFIQLALQKYPLTDTSSALLKLAEDIKEVKKLVYMVNSMIVTVTVTFPTIAVNPDTETMRIALGKFNIARLNSNGKSYEFHSDEMLSTIAVMRDSIKYNFVYKPSTSEDLLGLPIDQLSYIKTFAFNYVEELNEYTNMVYKDCNVNFRLHIKINNISIGKKETSSNFRLLVSGGMNFDISSLFKDIDKRYTELILRGRQ